MPRHESILACLDTKIRLWHSDTIATCYDKFFTPRSATCSKMFARALSKKKKRYSRVPFGGFTHWPFLLRHFSLDNAERAWRTRVRAGSWRWFFRLGRWEKAIATGSGSGSGNWGNESVARRRSYRDIVGLWFPQFPICRLCIRPAIKIHFITPRRTEIHVHARERSTDRARRQPKRAHFVQIAE